MATVEVRIGGDTFEASPEQPLVFGRGGEPGVAGLDPRDMGISARAGSIECSMGVWWVINRSRTRRLLVERRLPRLLSRWSAAAATPSPPRG
ncbi:MAG: hypothetical protein ACRDPR_08895 [Nocardioidaceae bacterium]